MPHPSSSQRRKSGDVKLQGCICQVSKSRDTNSVALASCFLLATDIFVAHSELPQLFSCVLTLSLLHNLKMKLERAYFNLSQFGLQLQLSSHDQICLSNSIYLTLLKDVPQESYHTTIHRMWTTCPQSPLVKMLSGWVSVLPGPFTWTTMPLKGRGGPRPCPMNQFSHKFLPIYLFFAPIPETERFCSTSKMFIF